METKKMFIFQVDNMYEISMTKNLIGITGRQRFMSKYEIKSRDTL